MKKHIMSWMLAALAFAGVAVQAQSDEAIFNSTVKQVDMGGTYLNYVNQTEIAKMVRQFADALLKSSMVKDNMEPEQLELITASVNVGLRLVGLEAYKAQAISAKSETAQFGAPMYFYKTFLYTGAEPQGIFFDLAPRSNKPFTKLQMVPANARLAFGGHITPAAAWEKIVREFDKETDPLLKSVPNTLTATLSMKHKVDLLELLKSVSGEYFVVITSSGTVEKPVFQLMAVLPDQNGVLGNLLKANIPPEFIKLNETTYMVPRTPEFPDWFAPQILLGEHDITLVTNIEILQATEAAKNNGLLKTSEAFLKGIPQEGIGYFYLDINKQLIDSLLNMAEAGNMNEIVSSLPSPRLFGASFLSDEGYNVYARSNISYVQIQTLIPLSYSAGMLLPALNTAREKARTVSCINNLKQIAMCAILFANDNEDKLPSGTSEEIFKQFVDKKYVPNMNIFHCPSCKTEGIGYYFIGGLELNKLKRPSTTPLAFDKPGNHATVVNVAFADGHVESIPILNYEMPEDLINAIATKYNLPAEDKADLLEHRKNLQ